EQVLDAPLDHVLLVVRGDDQGDGRLDLGLAYRLGADAPERRRGDRVAEVMPREPGRARPEDRLQDHGVKLLHPLAMGREEALVAGLAAAQLAVGVLVVDRLADRGRDEALGVEARLEVVQRVGAAAQASAEVEALVAPLLRPARRLEQDERRRARRAA